MRLRHGTRKCSSCMSQKPSARKMRVATKTALASIASAPECLVLVDVADDEAERIGEQHLVGHLLTEAVDEVRGPALALLFLLVPERVEDLLELDMGAVRGLASVVKDNRLDLDIHVRGAGVEQEVLEGLAFTRPRQRRRLQVVREEV